MTLKRVIMNVSWWKTGIIALPRRLRMAKKMKPAWHAMHVRATQIMMEQHQMELVRYYHVRRLQIVPVFVH